MAQRGAAAPPRTDAQEARFPSPFVTLYLMPSAARTLFGALLLRLFEMRLYVAP